MIRKKIKKFSIALISLLCIASISCFAYKKLNNKPVSNQVFAMDSLIEIVSKTEIKETITASGMVYLADEHEIYAEGETNIIKKFLVEEGDDVSEGQMLVEYDVEDKKTELESKIKETQTNLDNAELTLKSLVVPKTESEMIALKSSVTQAEKSLYDSQLNLESYETKINQQETTINNAKKDLEKAEKTIEDNKILLEAGAITQEEYDNSIDSRDKAADTYNQELENLEEIKKNQGSAEFAVKTAENSLEEAQIKLKNANIGLEDEATAIKYKQQQNQIELTKSNLADYKKELSELVYSTSSPVSGKVTEISVDAGTYTEENTVMLKVADFNKLLVKASIAEYDAPNISVGQSVEMTSDGLEGKVYTGKITKVEPIATSASTNMGSETVVPIEISVDNPDGILKPGYNLDLEIITLDKPDILAISSSAVLTDRQKPERKEIPIGENKEALNTENEADKNDNEISAEKENIPEIEDIAENSKKYYVFKLDSDNTLKKTYIEIEEIGEVQTEILSGLSEGDKIIASPSDSMQNGMDISEVQKIMEQSGSSSSKTNSNQTENSQGGNRDDRNSGFNQVLPSGGDRSGGPSGGFPQGR